MMHNIFGYIPPIEDIQADYKSRKKEHRDLGLEAMMLLNFLQKHFLPFNKENENNAIKFILNIISSNPEFIYLILHMLRALYFDEILRLDIIVRRFLILFIEIMKNDQRVQLFLYQNFN